MMTVGDVSAWATGLSIALALSGCGGSDSGSSGSQDPPPSCQVSVKLSGGADATLTEDPAPACLIPFGGDTGVWMVYIPGGANVSRFEVMVDDIAEGATGTFTASAGVTLKDMRVWSTASKACSIDVDEHSFESEDDFSKGYRMVGSGSCATPADAADGTSEPITIAPFTFRFPARWGS